MDRLHRIREVSPVEGLELDGAAFARLVDAVVPRLAEVLDGLATAPSAVTVPSGVWEGLRHLVRDEGRPVEEVLELLFDRALSHGFEAAGPSYLAYVPGGGVPHAAVADLVANLVNRYVGIHEAAPGAVELETDVVRWFAATVGYPAEARGFLSSGGSIANFSAVFTARRERLGDDLGGGRIYVSDQAHHSVRKAAMLAGFPPSAVCILASDQAGRLEPASVRAAVDRDRAAGLRPFLLVAAAGTTGTGAVDDLDALADLAADVGLWLHVDAAYGGFFMLTERGRAVLRGIGRADSITLDPHKGLFLPYGTGALLARDGAALARAHAMTGDYMPAPSADPDCVDFASISPELSRDFRGLRVWLPLMMAGACTYRALLDEKLELAARSWEALSAEPSLVLTEAPPLSLFAFRVRDADGETGDQATAALLAAVNRRGRVMLTPTRFKGRLVIRVCILCFRTHGDRVACMVEDVLAGLAELGR